MKNNKKFNAEKKWKKMTDSKKRKLAAEHFLSKDLGKEMNEKQTSKMDSFLLRSFLNFHNLNIK